MNYIFFLSAALSAARAAAMFHGPNGHCLRSLRSNMQMNRIMPPRMTKVSLPAPARGPRHIHGGVTEHAAEVCSGAGAHGAWCVWCERGSSGRRCVARLHRHERAHIFLILQDERLRVVGPPLGHLLRLTVHRLRHCRHRGEHTACRHRHVCGTAVFALHRGECAPTRGGAATQNGTDANRGPMRRPAPTPATVSPTAASKATPFVFTALVRSFSSSCSSRCGSECDSDGRISR